MEVKAGYKQTDAGVIPEDWAVCALAEAVEFLDGQRRPVKSSDRAKVNGIYPYYGASGIIDYVNDYIFDDDLILLGEDGENILSRNLPLAFRVTGKIWVNNHAHVLKPKDFYDIGFLTDYLENLDYSLLNSGTAQPKLNKHSCLRIKIAKPPKTEQIAIAAALSDTDGLIASLEKLIAKKRNIKQGAMQKLLQPKEGWEEKTYGEVFDFLTTASYSRAELTENDEVHYIHYGDIHTKWNVFLDIKESHLPTVTNQQVNSYHFLKEGDVIMADASEDYAGVGKSVEVKNLGSVKAISGLHTFLLRDKGEVFVNGFKGYIYLNKIVKTQFDRLATGLKVYGVSKANLKTVKIPVPPKEEQMQIATILIEMDNEISALEYKLEKYKNVKLGMMQTLLTGKIRLV